MFMFYAAVMKKLYGIMVFTIIGASFLVFFLIKSLPDGRTHVHFLDVGQGDGILILGPLGEIVMIDGGPDGKFLEQIGKILPFYVDKIDLVILTHPHADHAEGLISVLKRYNIANVLISGANYSSRVYEVFISELDDEKVHFAEGYEDFLLGKMRIDVLYPLESMQGINIDNINNSSVVVKIGYGKDAVYLSGDLEDEGEKKLIDSGLNLNANVYKAGHHGSRTSNNPELIKRIRPEFAVISAGAGNSYEHPHQETLDTLNRLKVKTYRTDLDGNIEFVFEGF
jgi:competence protein ComEC